MKRNLNKLIKLALPLIISAIFCANTHAQTATWTAGGGDGDWNNGLNWDLGAPPAEGTNAVIGAGQTVNYGTAMTAGSFGTLTLNSVLNVNAGGFVFGGTGNTAGLVSASGARLFINSGGAVSLTNGGLTFETSGGGSLAAGGSLSVSGPIRLGNNSSAGSLGVYTNNGGTLTAGSVAVNAGNSSSSSLFIINGGTNDLGNVTVQRSSASGSFAGVGTEGLIINGGLVRMTSLSVGTPTANSYLTMLMSGGIVTNTGSFVVREVTSARGARFLQTGGLFVSTDSNPVRVGITNAGQIAIYSITGGTNIVPGFLLGDMTNNSGTVNFTNAAKIYVGNLGLTSNAVATLNIALNNNGTFGASADWSSALTMNVNGSPFTFDASDLAGTPRNITLSGVLRGSGGITKIGNGLLTLNAANTYSGVTTVSGGRLALGASASVASSQIIVNTDGILDVSANPAFSLTGSQKLVGRGSIVGNVTVPSGTGIQPAGNSVGGTIVFSNALSETGNAINNFDLSDDPTGLTKTNDFIYVAGDLNLSGVNTIQVNPLDGTLPAGSTYTIIQYGGNLGGSIANLQVAGAVAVFSNDVPTKTISLLVQAANRNPTNDLVWVGNAVNNNWDNVNATTNWLSGGALTYFVTGDQVRFDAAGAANPIVNLVGSLNPSNTVVDAASAYTFLGSGTLDGIGGLTKTNSGTLTVLTANSYPGPTIVGGGTLEVTNLANGGAASSIGGSSGDPTNLVLISSTIRYLGGNATSDRGATVNETGGTVELPNASVSLTLVGNITGTGALIKSGPGTLVLSGGANQSGGTVISNGVLRINGPASAGGAGITNYGSTLRLATSTAVGNVVDFEGVCTLDLNNTGGNQALNGSWSGSGTVNIINQQNSTRVFTMGGNGTGGNMSAFTGIVNVGTNSGTFRFNDGGGTPNTGNSNMVLDLGSSSAIFYNRNRGTLNFLGALAGGSGTLLTNGTDGSGTTTYMIGGRNTDSTFAGTLSSATGAPIAVTKVGTGTLTLSGANAYTGATVISNGVLALSGNGVISRSPTISVLTNTTLDVSGRVDGTLTLNSGQTLQGAGTVRGSVTVGNGAALTVGDTSGISESLTITNALTLQSGSTLNMDLDHYQLTLSRTNDVISGLASVTYGGTLNLTAISVETNSVFKLFDAGSYSGAFSTISPPTPPLAAQWGWDTSYLTVDGTLRVAVLRPKMTSIFLSGSDLIIDVTDAIPGAEFHVLSSTNLLAPVSQWTPIATNFFGGSTFQFTLTGVVDTANPPQFYLLQVIVP